MAADPAPIPVVPLPIPGGSSAGKVPEGALLLSAAPWLLTALVLLGLAVLRQLLRGSIPGESGMGTGASWGSSPQLGPVQDPVYLQRILKAELESQQQSADLAARLQDPERAGPAGPAGRSISPSNPDLTAHTSNQDS